MFVFGFVQGLGCSRRSRPIVEASGCADACEQRGGGAGAIIFTLILPVSLSTLRWHPRP